jgi:pSer/pThr/pTyr-binding forkhead associated (FHA) protein
MLDVTADRVRLSDLGSLNGTAVDGVPAVAVDLVDGNRIQLGDATLVFHRDDHEDEGGREGGEGE